MAKNDVVVRSAADLEKKYNFASLLGLKKNVEITAQGIQKIENELNSMLNALVINLKDVLDSQSEISLWFYSGIPTTSNKPYTDWSNPSDHIGDLYYDQSTGYVYQYKEVKGKGLWEINASPDLIEAMAITNAESDTSTDKERKVFFDTPTIPYSNGDWWIKEDGSLFICQISKTSGTYETADFIDSSKYTENIAKKIGEELTVLKGTVTLISENYAKFTDLATGGSTTISGDNITTGSIQSQNYIKDVSGTKITLEDGTIEAKNFKVNSSGDVTCNNATINGSAILNGNNFSISKEGILTCSGANISGTITGSTIKGSTIEGNTITGGTISGTTINTDKDLTVGNNAYFGNQSSSVGTRKYLYLSKDAYLERLSLNGGSAVRLNAGVMAGISVGTAGITIIEEGVTLSDTPNLSTGGLLTKSSDSTIRDFTYGNDGNSSYLVVTRDIGFQQGITWWDSDEKLKTNIKDSNVNAIDVIKQIKHREYDRVDREEHSKLGYVAQELQEIDNRLVFGVKQKDGSTILNINQPNLIPYLTKAIQEQQEMIEQLKEEIKNLKEG